MDQKDYKWVSRPVYRPFLMQQIIELLITVTILLCCYGFWYLIQSTSAETVNWTILHVLFGFIVLRQTYLSIKKLNSYKYLQYKITDSRVEIVHGKNSEDFKSIDKEKIQFVKAKRSMADRIYGTKTIKLYSGELTGPSDELTKKFDDLENIENDNEVISLLTKAD